MVLENFPKLFSVQNAARYRLAFLYDRMAAFVLDFTVVFFAHSFLNFAIQREQSVAMIEGYQTAFMFWLLVNFLFFFFLYFFYNYISLLKYKTTLGKFAFKIHAKDIWGMEGLSHSQALKYSLWKTLGLFTFGFSYVGAFIDDKRRTLHEKMSDTVIVTKKQRHSPPPTEKEKQFFKGMLLPLHCLLLVAGLYVLVAIYQTAEKEIIDVNLEASLTPKCEWIENELEEAKEASRLQLAISLFLLNEIERGCLEKEARAAFEAGQELEEANMAFALLYPEDKEKYISEACKIAPGSFSCINSKEAKALFRKSYQVLWQAKESLEANEFENSLSLLNQIKDPYYKAKLGYVKFKSIWKLNSEDVMKSISTYAELMGEDTYDKVISWACFDSTQNSCDSAPQFCKKIINKKDFSRAGLEEEIAYVRLRECNKDWNSDLPLRFSEEAANLFYAKWRLEKHKDLRILRELLIDEALPYDIKQEVAKTMLRYDDLNSEDRSLLSKFQNFKTDRQPASE